MATINEAIRLAGGPKALARALGVTPQRVSQIARMESIPPNQVLPISRATAWRVTPHQLNPEIYPDPEWLPPEALEGAA